jgi:2-polyprenyl-3-methyl-5-hydroxy-6-metoxy-1,4-benzoquinol methylase
MSFEQEYFSNHRRADHFPWSVYHKPISQSLLQTIQQLANKKDQLSVLVVGPGAFLERNELPQNCLFTLVDIDARVTEQLKSIADTRVKNAITISSLEELTGFNSFDFIYAKEVIEHIESPAAPMQALFQLLKEGGSLWLSTPNYGFFLLPLLEMTILEFIARSDGFSRKEIHPRKYSQRSLYELFKQHGFEQIQTRQVSCKMALIGLATKPKSVR